MLVADFYSASAIPREGYKIIGSNREGHVCVCVYVCCLYTYVCMHVCA